MVPKSGIAATAEKNPDDRKMEFELTQIIIKEKIRVKNFPPSAARDAYLARTSDIGSTRMVSLDEYGEIQDLGEKADLEGIRQLLIAQGINLGES